MQKAFLQPVLLLLLISCNAYAQTGDYDSLYHKELLQAYKNAYRDHFAKKATALKIPVTVNSNDSFYLRLWVVSITGYRLFTISEINNNWQVHQYRQAAESGHREEYFNSKILTGELIDSLQKFELNNLVSQYNIPGFTDASDDGVTYTLELFKPGFYNVAVYHNPSFYAERESNNKYFLRIIRMLDQYFWPECRNKKKHRSCSNPHF